MRFFFAWPDWCRACLVCGLVLSQLISILSRALKTRMCSGVRPQSNMIAVVKFKLERMFVFGFFSIPLSHATKKLDIFFSIVCRSESLRQRIVLFVALSHCNQQIFVCCTESLWHTKFVYFAEKIPKRAQKCFIFSTFLSFLALFGTFLHFAFPFLHFFKKIYTLWHFLCKIYTRFVCRSARNKKSICRSDSVRQTKQIFVTVTQCNKQYWKKYPIYLWHVTKELEKKPKKNIVLNLNFTTAIKLLWGTLPTLFLCLLQWNKTTSQVS